MISSASSTANTAFTDSTNVSRSLYTGIMTDNFTEFSSLKDFAVHPDPKRGNCITTLPQMPIPALYRFPTHWL